MVCDFSWTNICKPSDPLSLTNKQEDFKEQLQWFLESTEKSDVKMLSHYRQEVQEVYKDLSLGGE